jgi:glutamate racemase
MPLLATVLLAVGTIASGNPQAAALAEQLSRQETLTVVIVDSGLGGLSVCADLEAIAAKRRVYRDLHLIFCNVLPAEGRGYNDLPDDQQKAAVFSRALTKITETCKPDAILIACNTLSVVYPQTDYAKRTPIPVVEIVDMAVDLYYQKLTSDRSAVIVLFGTETTIGSHAYKRRLQAKGVAASRIVEQACPKLESEIQLDPQSDATTTFVDWYVGEAAEKLGRKSGKVFAALCCTHYGYALPAFQKAFQDAGSAAAEIVNPNPSMSAYLFPQTRQPRNPSATTVRTISRARLSEEERQSISTALRSVSAKTADSLLGYEHRQDLF